MSSPSFVKKLLAVCLTLCLTGCTAAIPAPTPQPTLTTWTVQLSPAVTWLQPTLTSCARHNPQTGILVQIVSRTAMDFHQADLSIVWENNPADLPVYWLGNSTLTLIVNPHNALQAMQRDDWQKLVNGQLQTWEGISPSGTDIQWYLTPPGNEDFTILQQASQTNPAFNTQAWLVPEGSAAVQKVSENENAAAMISSNLLNDQVKPIEIEGVDQAELTRPLLAVMLKEPSDWQAQFLGCVYAALNH